MWFHCWVMPWKHVQPRSEQWSWALSNPRQVWHALCRMSTAVLKKGSFNHQKYPIFEKWTLMWFLCIFEQTIANLLPADTSKQSCKVCRWPESFDHFQDNILQFGRNPEPFWKCLLIDPTSMQRSNSNIGCCSRHAGLHCWLWSSAWLWCVPVGRPLHPAAAARGGSVRSVRGEHWKRWNWWGGGSLVRMRKEKFIMVRKGEETFFFVEFYPDTFDTSNMSQIFMCDRKMNEYFRYLGFSSQKTINIYNFLQLAAPKNWGKNTQLPRTAPRLPKRGSRTEKEMGRRFPPLRKKSRRCTSFGTLTTNVPRIWIPRSMPCRGSSVWGVVSMSVEGWIIRKRMEGGKFGWKNYGSLRAFPCFFFWLAVFNWLCRE